MAKKSAEEAPNVAKLKKNTWYGCTSKTKVDCLYRQVLEKFLNLTQPQNYPRKAQKTQKRPQICPN